MAHVARRCRSPARQRGGIDGGDGIHFANAGEDVHALGSLAPVAPVVGSIVLRPDGSRVLARVEPDPLAADS